jgi:hypothetical protein
MKPLERILIHISERKQILAMPRKKHHTGVAGTFAVAVELSRRNYEVSLTPRNSPSIDLLCASPNGIPFKVQVKRASSANFVPVGKARLETNPDDNLYLIIVLVPSAELPFQFFIMSHPEARTIWADVPKVKPNGEPYAAGWEGFGWRTIEKHENSWEKLPV